MSPQIKVVQSLYEAFGRGDVPAILAQIADSVDWGINVDRKITGPEKVPYFRLANTREEVLKYYFMPVLELFEFNRFIPKAFMAGDNHVSVLLDVELTTRRTQRRFAFEELHCFEIDGNQKIKRYRGFLDTAQMTAMLN